MSLRQLSIPHRISGAIVLSTTLIGCSSTPAPLAIRMHNPTTNQTLHCTARSETASDAPMLANAVEACAKQLEANGFVREK